MTKQQKKTPKQESKKKQEQKNDLKKDSALLIGIFVVITVFGLVLFSMTTTKNPVPEIETVEYGGFIFEKQGPVWVTLLTVEDRVFEDPKHYEVFFHYTPYEVEHIETMRNSWNRSITPNLFMDARKIYITTDPGYPSGVILGAVEIAKILGKIYSKNVEAAITRPYNTTDAPVITCDDIGPNVRVIHLNLGNSTRIYSNHGCIVVEGTNTEEVNMASERLAFEMLNIL